MAAHEHGRRHPAKTGVSGKTPGGSTVEAEAYRMKVGGGNSRGKMAGTESRSKVLHLVQNHKCFLDTSRSQGWRDSQSEARPAKSGHVLKWLTTLKGLPYIHTTGSAKLLVNFILAGKKN